MSMWPIPVAGQDLYEASTERVHVLGTIHNFDTANGTVMAMYCQNNNTASVAAGLAVGVGVNGFGYADTAALAAANLQAGLVLGGLAVSMAASSTAVTATNRTNAGGFGWVILHGPQTNAFLAATLALSAAARGIAVSSNAALSTGVTTHGTATNSSENTPIIALLRAHTTTLTSGTGHGGIVDWTWR